MLLDSKLLDHLWQFIFKVNVTSQILAHTRIILSIYFGYTSVPPLQETQSITRQ